MYVDSQLELSNAQAVTASAASTNYIDMLVTVPERGAGRPLYVVCNVQTAMTDSSSDSTVTVTIQVDADTAFSDQTTIVTLEVFAAVSAAGTRRSALLPALGVDERYLRGYYTVANGNLTTGSFDLFITTDVDTLTKFADNRTIS